METGIPARLELKKAPMTAAEGRKFGFTVGLGLTLGGLVVPTLLGPVEKAWMGLAHLISKVTTPLFMGIVYFVVMMPIGSIRKNVGNGSPIFRKPGKSQWNAHEPADGAQMERQF